MWCTNPWVLRDEPQVLGFLLQVQSARQRWRLWQDRVSGFLTLFSVCVRFFIFPWSEVIPQLVCKVFSEEIVPYVAVDSEFVGDGEFRVILNWNQVLPVSRSQFLHI